MKNKTVNREELHKLVIKILVELQDDLNVKQVAGRISLKFSGNIHTWRHNIRGWLKGDIQPSSISFMKYLATMLPDSQETATDDQAMKGMIVYEIWSMLLNMFDESDESITVTRFSKHMSDLFPIDDPPFDSEEKWRNKIKNERRWADKMYLYTRGDRSGRIMTLLQIIYGYLRWKDKKKPIIDLDYRFRFLIEKIKHEYLGD